MWREARNPCLRPPRPQSTPNDGLQPAELDYSQIALAYEGVAWAQLAKVDGSGAASWPRLLPAAAKSQCGCCKLCFAQNVAALADTTVSQAVVPAAWVLGPSAVHSVRLRGGSDWRAHQLAPRRLYLQGATPIKCKRWSYRSKDGVCRLFGPSSSTARSVALTAQTPKDQEWASGTGAQLNSRKHTLKTCRQPAGAGQVPPWALAQPAAAARSAAALLPIRAAHPAPPPCALPAAAERYVNLFSPGQVAPGTAQCQFIALGGGGLSGGGGLPGGLPGGSSLRPPPPAAKAVDAAAPVAKSPPPPSKKPPPPRPPPPSPRPPSPKPAAKKPPPPPPLVARKALQPMG